RVLFDTAGTRLTAAVERPSHPLIGRDAGEAAGIGANGVLIGDDPRAALLRADVWIDFSAPAASAHAAELCAEHGGALVIGTTGLDESQQAAIDRAAERVPAVVSSNMSVGVTVLIGLLEQAARALGPGFDLEIVELHHGQKKDAPSGTALMMAQ